jgi:1-deoxy-D-xylulose-5-phosphate synthase
MILCAGTQLSSCLKAAALLREEGLDVGVVNARFVKPLDTETVCKAIETCPFVITVEEASLAGGFGSAVLEAAADAGINAGNVSRLGIPDRFIEHGERGELLAELRLDVAGIAATCRHAAQRAGVSDETVHRRVS